MATKIHLTIITANNVMSITLSSSSVGPCGSSLLNYPERRLPLSLPSDNVVNQVTCHLPATKVMASRFNLGFSGRQRPVDN